MSRNRIGLGMAAAAALVLAASCSSSSKGSTGTSATSAPATGATTTAPQAPAPTGSPITIMVTGTFNGPGIGYPEATAGANAAADAINANGGLNGHPIKIDVCDDHYDPNQAVACAQKAISEKATALVGGVDFFAAQLMPLLESAKIPWVAPTVVIPAQFSSPMSFPVDGGGVIPQVAMGREAVQLGGKNIVVVSIDHAAALQTEPIIKQGASLQGGSIAALVKYAPGTADFSSTAASVVSHNPNAVVCLCSSQVDWSGLFKALVQAGYTGPFSTSVTFITTSILKSLGDSAKQVFEVDGQRPFDSTNPDLAQYQSEINKYAPSSAVKNQIMGDGWLGVHVIADALSGAQAVDAASLVTALNTKSTFPTYGLVHAITFTGQAPVPTFPRFFNVYQMAMKWDPGTGKVIPITDQFFNPFSATS